MTMPFWPEEKNDNAMPLSSPEAQKQWQKISRQTRMEKKHSKDSESEGEQVMMRELSAEKKQTKLQGVSAQVCSAS